MSRCSQNLWVVQPTHRQGIVQCQGSQSSHCPEATADILNCLREPCCQEGAENSCVRVPAGLLDGTCTLRASHQILSGLIEEHDGRNGRVSVENGRPLDPADWAVIDVVNYFRTAGFEEQASAFQEQEIDGKSLLLMTRNDVLTGLSLKLGPALKIYEYHVKPLQTQHLKNNSL
ncbi:Sterile alpha motif domain-containing protein 13 [Anas platyrhynchos]|uniref:Sterile alpha motif domain-containing protein 13 n=1 Tax=Anas platyrhynchos TaxID=8839 RepID=R0JQ82_ANAPL|nr:Sterile alpha motif domain-containing protein 13 [Anas platyrhynchos]